MSTADPQRACPSCDDQAGHQYDDDRHSLLYGLTDFAGVGDPCMWCSHEKCPQCPPPRGLPFAEAHAQGDESCWDPACPLPYCVRAATPTDGQAS